MTTGWRFLAVRALTGEILEWNLPLQEPEFTRNLSASPSLTAHIDPSERAELLMAKADDGLPILDVWSTAIFVEDPAKQLRYGGLLVQPTKQGSKLDIECTGYFGWLARQLYRGTAIHYKGGDFADPVGELDVPDTNGGVVRTLVRAAQAYPDADMGIVVDGATKSVIRIGTPETTDEEGEKVDAEPVSYTPWEHPSIGDSIAELANEQPGFDFIESHEWTDPSDPDSTSITHRLTLHYPRAGRRRSDLKFQTGVNISSDEPEIGDGDNYANVVIADGAGEGSKALREEFPRRDGRPRVMVSEDAQHITSKKQLQSFAKSRATARASMLTVPSITVIDHPNAPLGSWGIGDDIFVQLETGWGDVAQWFRIVSDSWTPDSPNVATLTLEPANSFVYGKAV